jgi:hypothetical protein
LANRTFDTTSVQKTKFGGELTHQRRRQKIAVLWRLGGDFPSSWENFRLK